MNRLMTNLMSFLALAPALLAGPRTPQGIYATVGISMYEANYLKAHHSMTSVPSDYFTGTVYPDLLANPELSGITLYVYWSRLNPNPAPVGLVGERAADLSAGGVLRAVISHRRADPGALRR